MELKVFTAFSGYDSQLMALRRLEERHPDFKADLVGWAEIEPNAIKAHNAIFPEYAERNYGDISKIDWATVPDFDLFTYSSPCQDFSQAGKQKGGQEGSGTRSSLLWECRRAILAKKPKYLILENVAALVSEKFLPTFRAWEQELANYGYDNYCKVLNAKHYGVPQNRERIFLVSILNGASFQFPKKKPLEKKLADVLEKVVKDKYYLNADAIQSIIEHCDRKVSEGCGFKPDFKDAQSSHANYINTRYGTRQTDTFITEPINTTKEGLAYTIRTEYGKSPAQNFVSGGGRFPCTGVAENDNEKVVVVGMTKCAFENDARIYSPSGSAPTLRTKTGGGKNCYP